MASEAALAAVCLARSCTTDYAQAAIDAENDSKASRSAREATEDPLFGHPHPLVVNSVRCGPLHLAYSVQHRCGHVLAHIFLGLLLRQHDMLEISRINNAAIVAAMQLHAPTLSSAELESATALVRPKLLQLDIIPDMGLIGALLWSSAATSTNEAVALTVWTLLVNVGVPLFGSYLGLAFQVRLSLCTCFVRAF